jgi:hypothetical protein
VLQPQGTDSVMEKAAKRTMKLEGLGNDLCFQPSWSAT